jgi:SpoVK/Ycf46/Vps4 family AAA+-type ATPase
MATADQIKSLIRSHTNENSEQFYTVALQVAAHEARVGHGALAHDIKALVDKARKENRPVILQFPNELQGFVLSDEPSTPRSALVVPPALADRVERVVREHRQKDKLKSHGLTPRRRIMAVGPPGTGKTMTAHVLAHELRAPLHTIQVDRIVTKFMGETAAKLRQIFDLMYDVPGVYLFDEFDAIGGARTLDNDVGEMRRVLNAFLQFIEKDTSDSVIFCATNSPDLLDQALFRRYDDVLHYSLPDENERRRLIQNVLGSRLSRRVDWDAVLSRSKKLSHAEIDLACRDTLKHTILSGRESVDLETLGKMLDERKSRIGS